MQTNEFEIIKLSEKVRNLSVKWGKENNLSDVNFGISLDKGKEWIYFPLHPNISQLEVLERKMYDIKRVKPSKLIYFFQGKDSSGRSVIDNNNGKNYRYKNL